MATRVLSPSFIYASLQRRWLAYALIAAATLFIAFFALQNYWGLNYAARWFAQAALVLVFQAGSLYQVLWQNYREGEDILLPTLGPGNVLSISRGVLTAMVAGFFFLPRPIGWLAWIPAVLYIISDIMDFLDGYLARISNHATRLGETLDMNNDALGVLVVTLLAFQYGIVPWWYALFGFARFAFVFALWVRRRLSMPVYELKPSLARRGFAALQMGFVTVMLFPLLGPPGTTAAATIFLIPFVLMFIYDWLQVSGQLSARDPEAGHRWGRVWRFVSGWLPLALRALAVGVTVWQVYLLLGSDLNSPAHGAALDRLIPQHTLLVFALMQIFVILMTGLGAAGRTVAIIALITAGFKLQYEAFSLDYWLLLFAFIGILFLGTGKFSLWKPEDWLIHNRAGA